MHLDMYNFFFQNKTLFRESGDLSIVISNRTKIIRISCQLEDNRLQNFSSISQSTHDALMIADVIDEI